jgi:hypothetical protein
VSEEAIVLQQNDPKYNKINDLFNFFVPFVDQDAIIFNKLLDTEF